MWRLLLWLLPLSLPQLVPHLGPFPSHPTFYPTPPPLPLPGTLREDADALCGRSVTDGAFWLCRLADLPSALHAEQVVAAGHQGCRHLALETHEAVPVDPGADPNQSRNPGARAAFQSAQNPRGETHAAAASLWVGRRPTGEGGGRAGGVTGRWAAGAGARCSGEGAAAGVARLQPGESAEGVTLSTTGKWVIQRGDHACVLRQSRGQSWSDGAGADAAAIATQRLLLRGAARLIARSAVDERRPDVGSTELEAQLVWRRQSWGGIAPKSESPSAAGACAKRASGTASLGGLPGGAEAVCAHPAIVRVIGNRWGHLPARRVVYGHGKSRRWGCWRRRRGGRMVASCPGPQSRPQSPTQGAKAFKTDISAISVEVIVSLEVYKGSSSQGDVSLDLLSRSVHVLWHPSHLEHGVFFSTRCHDVGVSLLLDALDCCPFWSNN